MLEALPGIKRPNPRDRVSDGTSITPSIAGTRDPNAEAAL